ncbi:MAG: hypothetical protein QOE88_2748 [Verrucomicrobiota bacterium]|nr:hypothetical protein [Verrucomicrobiota bacterium]
MQRNALRKLFLRTCDAIPGSDEELNHRLHRLREGTDTRGEDRMVAILTQIHVSAQTPVNS